MRVLLLGSGGREHAIGWKLAQSPDLEILMSAPGNPGLAALGPVFPSLDPLDFDEVARVALANRIDLVVVGPEGPLAAGVVDALTKRGIMTFGPTRKAARLEASKSYAKEVMARAGVPTAAARSFGDLDAALAHIDDLEGPYVVKADGLAAGKGVLVTERRSEARDWARRCLNGGFAEAGTIIVIEDYLEGPELSVMALCDGQRAVGLPAARDHKRLLDSDLGPNTGGMGCFSPVDIPEGLVAEIVDTVMAPVTAALAAEGVPYRGFLYAGLVLTPEGPRVLEFNCRLGDPEAQVVLPLLDEDLLTLLATAASGQLPSRELRVHDKAAVDVVLAAPGYPDAVRIGSRIEGAEDAERTSDSIHIFHAGTEFSADGMATSGGRVLNVVGLGRDVAAARAAAYTAVDKISFAGKQFRHDIGAHG
jgi:phosphoribosylamine--glycine ligase